MRSSPELRHDVVGPDALLLDREEVVARLVQADSRRSTKSDAAATVSALELTRTPNGGAGGVDVRARCKPAKLARSARGRPSSCRRRRRRRAPPRSEPATSECVSSASASACAGWRLQIRMIGSSSTVCIASTCERPCTPEPSTATVRASRRASSFVATAETAAVRISVIGDALRIADQLSGRRRRGGAPLPGEGRARAPSWPARPRSP